MPGDMFTLKKGRVEGLRKNTGLKVKLTGERSFHHGADKIPAEAALCKRIFNVLNAHYNGHAWAVEVDFGQGMAKITIPSILGFNFGYLIRLDELDRKAIIRGGGEILERFKIPRSTVDINAYMDAKARIPLLGHFRAGSGRLIPA